MAPPEVNAAERVRRRVNARLTECGISKRDFGKRMGGRKDAWAGGVLKGTIKFALRDLDDLAQIVRLTPSELVRRDDSEPEFLTPSEARLVRALRQLPHSVKDHLVILAEYLVGVMPPEIELLMKYRQLSPEERRRLEHAAAVLLLSQDA